MLRTGRGRWVLAATVLGSGIAFLDSTVVGIALPAIHQNFGGGVAALQWVVTGYSLTLAAFLLLGGAGLDEELTTTTGRATVRPCYSFSDAGPAQSECGSEAGKDSSSCSSRSASRRSRRSLSGSVPFSRLTVTPAAGRPPRPAPRPES